LLPGLGIANSIGLTLKLKNYKINLKLCFEGKLLGGRPSSPRFFILIEYFLLKKLEEGFWEVSKY